IASRCFVASFGFRNQANDKARTPHAKQLPQSSPKCFGSRKNSFIASRRTAGSSGRPAVRSRSMTRPKGASRGTSFAQPTMNSSAFGSRSLLRKGEGSIEKCFNSATCTWMTAHLGGSGSPAEWLPSIGETVGIIRELRPSKFAYVLNRAKIKDILLMLYPDRDSIRLSCSHWVGRSLHELCRAKPSLASTFSQRATTGSDIATNPYTSALVNPI